MKKKILIIGNGAKEFALAKKLSEAHEIFITSLSDAVKDFATQVDIREDSISELLEFVMENGIDMTIPLSLKALNSNLVDIFTKNSQNIFAPSCEAAKIVFDKALAKKILYKLRIQTPKFGIFEKQTMVLDYIKNLKHPFVLKTDDNNSATIFTNYQTAKAYVDTCFIEKNKRIIIEDYVYGTPFSFYAITDGYKALPFGSYINYKYSLDGNGGQLTNGMGACSPNYKLTIEQEYFIMDNIIYPTLEYLEMEENPYLGVLGVNGILTEDGNIIVLGWQSFMQDCDAVSILENLNEDLYSLFESCIIGSFSDEVNSINTKDNYAVNIVLRNQKHQNNENIIRGLDSLDENTIVTLYPSVKKNKYLEYEADYGEVLSLTTAGATLSRAIANCYEELSSIVFDGKYFRKDIGK